MISMLGWSNARDGIYKTCLMMQEEGVVRW